MQWKRLCSKGQWHSLIVMLKDIGLWTVDLFEVPRWTMGLPNQSRRAQNQSRRRDFLSCLSVAPAGFSKEISSRLLFLWFAAPFLFYIFCMFDLTFKIFFFLLCSGLLEPLSLQPNPLPLSCTLEPLVLNFWNEV